MIERIHNLIVENPCDHTNLIEAEKERLRKELPPIISRHNIAKKQGNNICTMAPIVVKEITKKEVKRTNIHQKI
jgi:hypothetical protein